MPQNETTTKFKVDISELKKGIQDAQRQIRLANAEFKAASSGMDDWSKSADGITAKLKQLDTTLGAQKTVLGSLESQYAEVVKEQGAASKGAEELKIKIANQQAAIGKTEKDIRKYKQALADLDNESGDAADGLEELAKSADDAGKSAGSAEGGFTILKGALASLAADAIKTCVSGLVELGKELATDLPNAYAQFSASTGIARDAMGEYEEAIKNVYKNNFGESLQDVAEKMAKVKEVTGELDASKLEDMTKKAMTLEDTFGMDMTESLRGVQSLMNHFGMTSEEAFDLVAAGAQNGLNYTDELGDNVAEYSGKFAEAGFTADEYFQLLKNGAEGGAYNLDKVNDAVNEVTTRLADGTIADTMTQIDEKTGEVKEGTGIWSAETEKLFAAWQSGGASQKDVMASIVKDIQGAETEQEKMNLAAKAFGTMAEDGGTKFIEALSPVGDTFTDVTGKAEELAAVKYDTPLAALQGVGRTIKTDLIAPMVEKLMPTINNVAAWVTENLPAIIEKVKEVAGSVKEGAAELEKWTPLLVGIGAAIATYFAVTQIAAFVGWIKSGAAAIKMMEIAQAALNLVMSLNPIGLVIAAIVGLIAAFVLLWNKSEAFRNFWIDLWKKIQDTAKKAWDAIKKWFSDAWVKVKQIWSAAGAFFSGVWNGIKLVFSVVASWFGSIFTNAWNNVKNAFSTVKTFFTGVWNGIKTIFNGVGAWFKTKFDEAYKKVTGAFNGIKGFFEGVLKKIKDVFTNVGVTIGEAVSGTVKKAVNGILSTATKIINGFIDAINSAIGVINKIPGVSISKIGKLEAPQMWQGGVLKKGQVGILEGNGAEAVVPLDRNKKWIARTAQDMSDALRKENVIAGSGSTATNYTFNQYNNSPKALSRLEIYRQTRNQLAFAKGV